MRADRVHLASPKLWSDDDVAAWAAACEEHGVDPLLLLKCASHESGASPSAIHKWTDAAGTHYGAAGLIQLEPENLVAMGFRGGPQAFANLTVSQQCPFVSKYLAWFPNMRGRGLAGVYAGLFIPAQIDLADRDPDARICGKDGPYPKFYAGNIDFDQASPAYGGRKGFITGSDLVRAAEAAFAACPIAQDAARRFDTPTRPDLPSNIPAANTSILPPPLDIPGETEPSDPDAA